MTHMHALFSTMIFTVDFISCKDYGKKDKVEGYMDKH